MIVTDDRVARFVSQRVGAVIYPPFTCMGIERDGHIIGGAIFNCYTGPNIEATVAGHGFGREFLREVGKYVFGQLGCQRITATTEQESVTALAVKLGGKIEGKLRNFYGEGRDATIIGILRSEYRYLR